MYSKLLTVLSPAIEERDFSFNSFWYTKHNPLFKSCACITPFQGEKKKKKKPPQDR